MKSSTAPTEAFRAEGFKITPQRQTIFDALERMHGSHPTAEAVCDDCGAVVDVHADFPGASVPDGLDDRFEVSTTEITFRGRCKACVKASNSQTTKTNSKENHDGTRR